MIDPLHHGAQKLKDSEPGHRFRARYHRLQAERDGRFSWKTILNLFAGVGLVAAGIVFWFIPGPGWGFILLGLGFWGSESLAIARTLDRLEVHIRRIAAPLGQWWNGTSLLLKTLVGLLLLAGTAAFGYGLLTIVAIR